MPHVALITTHTTHTTRAPLLSQVLKLTGEVSGDEHGRQDGAFQLPARVELLQAVDRLLTVDHAGNALSLLKGNNEWFSQVLMRWSWVRVSAKLTDKYGYEFAPSPSPRPPTISLSGHLGSNCRGHVSQVKAIYERGFRINNLQLLSFIKIFTPYPRPSAP